MRLPAASVRTSSPAASIRRLTYARPATSASLNATRLTPPSGFAPKCASSSKCCCSRAESARGSCGSAAGKVSSGASSRLIHPIHFQSTIGSLPYFLDDSLGHRTMMAGELIHTGAQVRTQLTFRIGHIADLAELLEGVAVI